MTLPSSLWKPKIKNLRVKFDSDELAVSLETINVHSAQNVQIFRKKINFSSIANISQENTNNHRTKLLFTFTKRTKHLKVIIYDRK